MRARSPRQALTLLGLLAVLSTSGGCAYHHHRVGTGPAGVGTTSVRQWYLGFGWFRLNEVDTQRFAEDSVSYDITTEREFSDLLISLVLSPLTVSTRTVTVER